MSLLLAAGFAACNNDGFEVGEVDLGYLKLISSDVRFDYSGGTRQIVVDTEHTVRYFKSSDESSAWLDEVVVNKNVVSVTVSEYTEMTIRNTSLTLVSGGRRIVVPISQGIGVLRINDPSISINSLPTSSSLAGNRAFSYSPAGSQLMSASDNVDWITSVSLNRETGMATIDATANTARTARTGEVTLTFGDQKKTITVTQAAAALFTNPTSLSFSHGAGSQEVDFDMPNSSGDATVSSNREWVTVSIDNATKVVTVNVEANTTLGKREATVTVRYGTLSQTVSIVQAAPPQTN